MQAVPVEQLETLFFGKPTPLKKQPRLQSVWSNASATSSGEGSQAPAGVDDEEDDSAGTAALLQHIQEQLGEVPVDVVRGDIADIEGRYARHMCVQHPM